MLAPAQVAALQSERITLDRAAQELGAAGTQLDQWLAGNERALAAVTGAVAAGGPAEGGGGGAQLDPDSVIVAADTLSQQALEVQVRPGPSPLQLWRPWLGYMLRRGWLFLSLCVWCMVPPAVGGYSRDI